MLVFISDIHLTDGTSGETINSRAFKKFVQYLKNMAATAKVKEIEIVLLGDIFDVIRSDYWLKSNNIRPWSESGKKDKEGNRLEHYTREIVGRIRRNPSNKRSIKHLKDLKKEMKPLKVDVKFTYIVGNHDWLINRYPETRTEIARFLGLDDPNRYKDIHFPTDGFWEEYGTFARHGDIYDPLNFDGDRDASSVGDAVVIEMINRFHKAIEKNIDADANPQLISQLREIDNVRPLMDVPLWIQGACRRFGSKGTWETVKGVWNTLVNEFLELDFIRRHDKPWRMDPVDTLEWVLRISKHQFLRNIAEFPLRMFRRVDDDYRDKAYNEKLMLENEAESVVYGHTHNHCIQPLDLVPMNGEDLQKIYFNTGTWKKIHRRTAYDKESYEFMGWKVMTFIAFYRGNERKRKAERKFEIWNGALG